MKLNHIHATTSWVKEIAKAKVNKASQFIKGEKRFSERFSIPVIAIISECDAICAKILVADLMMCFMSRNWIRSEEICVVTLYKMMPLRNWAVWYRQRCSYTFLIFDNSFKILHDDYNDARTFPYLYTFHLTWLQWIYK